MLKCIPGAKGGNKKRPQHVENNGRFPVSNPRLADAEFHPIFGLLEAVLIASALDPGQALADNC